MPLITPACRVYADAGGTLVANGVGAGLEIDSGAIRIDADAVPLPGGGDGNGDAGFWNRNDTTNTITTRTAGDFVAIGGRTDVNRNVGATNPNQFNAFIVSETDNGGTETVTFKVQADGTTRIGGPLGKGTTEEASNIALEADGSARFSSQVTSGAENLTGNAVKIFDTGKVKIRNDSANDHAIEIFTGGTTNADRVVDIFNMARLRLLAMLRSAAPLVTKPSTVFT